MVQTDRRRLLLLARGSLLALLCSSCYNTAQLENEQALIAYVGMPTEAFNAQSIVKRDKGLVERTADVFGIRIPTVALRAQSLVRRERGLVERVGDIVGIEEPHVLNLHINGRVMRLKAGGAMRATFVRNSFYTESDNSDPRRISAIRFDIGRRQLTLNEALNAASSACTAMESAGLRPSEDIGGEASTAEPNHGSLMQSWEGLPEPAHLKFCSLQDSRQVFQLEVTNTRLLVARSIDDLQPIRGKGTDYVVSAELKQLSEL